LEKSPVIVQFIVRFLIVNVVILILFTLLGIAGFNAQGDAFFVPSLKQSITAGAIKVVLVVMFALYFAAAYILEFGGLGLRYLLSKAR